mmetsp:Transcript_62377/g.197594  ORF Transcript_62377/g.197594 Transcript_62377/m.197594 type:complete len:220 (-) Transcript_62377:631-1290(-)
MRTLPPGPTATWRSCPESLICPRARLRERESPGSAVAGRAELALCERASHGARGAGDAPGRGVGPTRTRPDADTCRMGIPTPIPAPARVPTGTGDGAATANEGPTSTRPERDTARGGRTGTTTPPAASGATAEDAGEGVGPCSTRPESVRTCGADAGLPLAALRVGAAAGMAEGPHSTLPPLLTTVGLSSTGRASLSRSLHPILEGSFADILAPPTAEG